MNRLGLSLVSAFVAAQAAQAGEVLPQGQAGQSAANARCAALGEGFFAVNGSDACMRISGHISAGVGFGSGHGGSSGVNFAPAPPASSGFGTEAAGQGDLRFNTPAGPARVYVDVGNRAKPHWLIDSQ